MKIISDYKQPPSSTTTEPFDLRTLLRAEEQNRTPSTVARDPSGTGGLVATAPKRINLRELPQDGGIAQTSEQLIKQSQSSDPRVLKLFGNVQQTNALDVRPEMRGAVPPGREASLREDDQTAIAGLDALVRNGTIDANTIVIIAGGHAVDGMLRLTDHPHLRAQGVIHAVYRTFPDNPQLDQMSGSYRALNHLNSLQTYGDRTRERLDSHGSGGTIALGINTHGTWPDHAKMPSAEDILKVMGPNANVVIVNEMDTGRQADPTSWRVPLQPWLQEIAGSGIPISVHGIDSRRKNDPNLGIPLPPKNRRDFDLRG